MTTVHSFSAAIIIFVSVLAMLVIYRNRKLHNVQGILRFNLALSDCLCSIVFVGSAILPHYLVFSPSKFKKVDNPKQKLREIYFYASNGTGSFENILPASLKIEPIDETYVNIFAFVCYSAAFSSMYLYLAASIDRFIAIKYPYKYKISASKSKAYKTCILLWIFASLFTSIPVLHSKTRFWFSLSLFVFYYGKLEVFYDLVYHFLPLFFCWVLNILILVSIRSSKKKITKVLSTIQVGTKHKSSRRFDTRVVSAAKTLSIMVFVFTLSFLPFGLFQLTHHYANDYRFIHGVYLGKKEEGESTGGVQYVLCVVMLYNNFWNFFIYQVRDPNFRSYTKSLFFADKKRSFIK